MKKLAFFLALLASFITILLALAMKLFTSFSLCVKISRCTFIVQSNGYCLKLCPPGIEKLKKSPRQTKNP